MLNVRDVTAEREFYERLGLPLIYEGEEYPDFIAFGTDKLHFGIQPALVENDPPSCADLADRGFRYRCRHRAVPEDGDRV